LVVGTGDRLAAYLGGMSEFTVHEAREALIGTPIPWGAEMDRRLRREIAKITAGRVPLHDALTAIAELHPALRRALEGVVAGASGRLSQRLDTGNPRIHRSLTVGWEREVVEFAYLA
jgi:hypothetical protein